MQKIATAKGYEVWAQYDSSADVWELFASEDGDDYLGCADTLQEAREAAQRINTDRVGR